jgi:hypothetical protein
MTWLDLHPTGYQAGLWMGREHLWLPLVLAGNDKRGKPNTRLTFYRKRTTLEFFPLNPFEPPTVPLATIYDFRFVSMFYPHPHLGDVGRFSLAVPYEMKMGHLPIDAVHALPTSRNKR